MKMEIIFRTINAPLCCRAFTLIDKDGIYNVYVNEDLNFEAQERAIRHELEHIRQGHLESELPVEILERMVNDRQQKTPR